mmetsp:Transcript_27772/g.69318  ORF Transcript_27772/g.69318 Transcript_27772/m.69318 type:complete len:202 (-) Transcript_27772:4672-5277(-)
MFLVMRPASQVSVAGSWSLTMSTFHSSSLACVTVVTMWSCLRGVWRVTILPAELATLWTSIWPRELVHDVMKISSSSAQSTSVFRVISVSSLRAVSARNVQTRLRTLPCMSMRPILPTVELGETASILFPTWGMAIVSNLSPCSTISAFCSKGSACVPSSQMPPWIQMYVDSSLRSFRSHTSMPWMSSISSLGGLTSSSTH